jgi:ribose-phosphate pyrophosphokinase
MIIFNLSQLNSLAYKLSKLPGNRRGRHELGLYASGELYLTIASQVQAKECLIIAETGAPSDNTLALCMLTSTLKQAGASQVAILSPYLGYSRQEHILSNTCRTTYLLGAMLKTAGADKLITVDLHNPDIIRDFPITLINLSASPLYQIIITKLNKQKPSLLAPDTGAIQRCQDLKSDWPLAHISKKRQDGIIKMQAINGPLNSTVVIYDDILSTGQTLTQAVSALKKRRVKKIYIIVTHGQFKTAVWHQLLKDPVVKIYSTNSCPEARRTKNHKLSIIDLDDYLLSYFQKISK